MCDKLAIVIPAFKIEFFDEALQSIVGQTKKNFTLYIGNDNSPHDLGLVVQKYKSVIDIHYKKFDNNLGSISLVKQWERCINMIGNEEWIWLFSDDDIMEENAVESFYKKDLIVDNIYRFNLNIIDKDNNRLSEVIYPETETSVSFLENRLQHKYINAITNYVFSR
jgi:glycosyltransferase involved in cell wall biosynthesis